MKKMVVGAAALLAVVMSLGMAPAANAASEPSGADNSALRAANCLDYSGWSGDSSHSNAYRYNGANWVTVRAYVKRNYGGQVITQYGSWGATSSTSFSAGYAVESHYLCASSLP